MNFIRALKELKEGNCKGINPRGTVMDGVYALSDGGVLQYYSGCTGIGIGIGIHLHYGALLGEWELVKPIIIPAPGEVWINIDDDELFFIGERLNALGSLVIAKIWPYTDRWDVISDNMIDGKNLWKRLYSPGEGINHE